MNIIKFTFINEGVKGFYKGISLNLIKVLLKLKGPYI